jgi:serine/threonine-protein kinase
MTTGTQQQLQAGQVLGRYRVTEPIGKGGMGEVYRAHDTELERDVALKVLPAEVAADRQRMQRFIQEAKTASALNHPNIITIYEVGQAEGARFIATEYIKGETLRQRLNRESLSLRESLEVGVQVAAALAAAHEAKIIHRDIKPENIMLRPDGLVKVLDFGLAKLTEEAASATETDPNAPTRLQINTAPGVVMGTFNYMSPEQARGKEVDARTDIWSFGVVLYEMVTGHLPFSGETSSDVIAALLKNEPAPLTTAETDIPAELQRISGKTLKKERDERYQNTADLLVDLKNLKQDITAEARRATTGIPTPTRSEDTRAEQGSILIPNPTADHAAVETHLITSNTTSFANQIRQRIALVLAVVLVALLGLGAVYWWRSRTKAVNGGAITSLAVFPFKSLALQSGEDYLGVGLADVTITRLGSLDQLVVRPLQSVMNFATQDPLEAGRALKVDAVLDGTVQRSGDRIRITLRLLRVSNGTPLWTDQFDERGTDIFALQDAISNKVTEALALQLNSAQQQQLAKHYTHNEEAYRAYLKGRYYRNQFTPDGFKQAIDSFNQAIKVDPKYALAFAGLADTYYWSAYFLLPAPEAMTKAKEAAQQALALDEQLAEAHLALGQVRYVYDWQFVEAEQHFKRALAINPGLAEAHLWYGQYLALMGRFDDGLAELRRAEQVDPLSPLTTTTVGLPLWLAGRDDEAIAVNLKAIELNPSVPFIHINLGITYANKGEGTKAIAEFQRVLQLGANDPDNYALLAYGYASTGNRAEAEETLKRAFASPQAASISPYSVACVYISLGDKERAFSWLEKAFAERSEFMVWLKTDRRVNPLRSDQRFTDLMRRVGLLP